MAQNVVACKCLTVDVSAKRGSDSLWMLTFGEKINFPLLWVNSGERLPEMSSWSTRVLRLSTVVWDDMVRRKSRAWFLGRSTMHGPGKLFTGVTSIEHIFVYIQLILLHSLLADPHTVDLRVS